MSSKSIGPLEVLWEAPSIRLLRTEKGTILVEVMVSKLNGSLTTCRIRLENSEAATLAEALRTLEVPIRDAE